MGYRLDSGANVRIIRFNLGPFSSGRLPAALVSGLQKLRDAANHVTQLIQDLRIGPESRTEAYRKLWDKYGVPDNSRSSRFVLYGDDVDSDGTGRRR